MPPSPSGQHDSQKPARHPIRDGVILTAVYAAEAISTVQGAPPRLISTPTTPAGRPLITQEERDLADVKRKEDEDRLFDLGRAPRPPDQVEYRDRERDRGPER
jgi:hypothetical protein